MLSSCSQRRSRRRFAFSIILIRDSECPFNIRLPPELLALCSYGPKGAAVIESTIIRMFSLYNQSEALQPVQFKTYVNLVLVPYVGQHLIAEDQSCTVEEAFEIMVESRRVGAILHTTDDAEMDDLIILNQRLAKREKERVSFPLKIFVMLRRQLTMTPSLGTRNCRRPRS